MFRKYSQQGKHFDAHSRQSTRSAKDFPHQLFLSNFTSQHALSTVSLSFSFCCSSILRGKFPETDRVARSRSNWIKKFTLHKGKLKDWHSVTRNVPTATDGGNVWSHCHESRFYKVHLGTKTGYLHGILKRNR